MNQKVNLLTLRKKSIKNLRFNNHYKTFQLVLEGLNFIKLLEISFMKKGVVTISKVMHLSGNKYFLNFVLFYRVFKQFKYKKNLEFSKIRYLKDSKNKNENINILKKKPFNSSFFLITFSKNYWLKNKLIKKDTISVQNFSNLVLQFLNFNSTNLCHLTFKVLKIKKENYNLLKIHFSQLLTFYSKRLFVRRYNLYKDFLDILCLLIHKKVSLESLVLIMNIIFKFLSKKNHSLFFSFFRLVFFSMREVYNKKKFRINEKNRILGIKYRIGGRLKGKTRKNSETIQVGAIPVRSIDKNIEYTKSHIHTLYGVFGLKVWLYRIL